MKAAKRVPEYTTFAAAKGKGYPITSSASTIQPKDPLRFSQQSYRPGRRVEGPEIGIIACAQHGSELSSSQSIEQSSIRHLSTDTDIADVEDNSGRGERETSGDSQISRYLLNEESQLDQPILSLATNERPIRLCRPDHPPNAASPLSPRNNQSDYSI